MLYKKCDKEKEIIDILCQKFLNNNLHLANNNKKDEFYT